MPTSVKRDLFSRLKGAIDQDTFVRANVSSGWGTPTLGAQGSSWVASSGPTLSLVSNQGKTTGTTGQHIVTLGSLTLGNCEAICTFSTSATANGFGVFLRSSDINNQYRFRYQNGSFFITRVLTSTNTNLATASFTVTPTTGTYTIRARCMGPVLCAKIWDATTTEPTSWTLVTSDQTFSSGKYGVYGKLNTTSDTNFSFTFAVFDTRMQVNVPLRAIVMKPEDISTRVSVLKPKNLFTRMVLWSGQDLFTRLTLMRPHNFSTRLILREVRDLFARMRLLSQSTDNLPARLTLLRPHNFSVRLVLQNLIKDYPARLRLAVLRQRNFSTRLNLYIPTYKDLFARLFFAQGNVSDISTRLDLTLPDAWSLFTRLILAISSLKNLPARLVLIPTQQQSLFTRVRMQAQGLRDWSLRLYVQVTQFPTLPARLIFLVQSQRSVLTRLNLYVPASPAIRALAARLLLLPLPLKDTSATLSPILGYTGQAVLPINRPMLPYMANGIVLDTQPYLYSTPLALDGNIIPTGSLFVLVFANPSFATQLALADGASITLRFGLANGSSVTGPVVLASTLSGTTLTVVVTVREDIPINTRIISTQFF